MLKNRKNFSLPEIEEEVLRFWKQHSVFEQSLKQREGEKTFRFYEGPPYANGKPGIHHVLARVVKDIILRFKTMQGFYVPRKAGWDTHGLPVEIAAEKALGLKSKKDIEQFGIAHFNQKAKEAVWQYKDEWEKLTERIGYWLDLKNAYVTYSPNFIESLWWIFSEINKKKLLKKMHKVLPWCTRCGTALSSHEIAQGYKEVTETSVYVKFKLKKGQKIGKNFVTNEKTYILSWTTTPWTLPGNVALAVGEKIEYSLIEVAGETYVIASERLATLFPDAASYTLRATCLGKDLVGLSYEPLFKVPFLKSPKSYKVYAADFVTTTDGTGVVHTAVMYGEDDYRLGISVGLPQQHTVLENGRFVSQVQPAAGLYVKSKEAEDKLLGHLVANNALLKKEDYTHEYPHCWRCSSPVLYYARTSWFIEMSKLRKKLLAANKEISWFPGHIKDGRFGEWLKDAKDWAVSRERYWGTPLPIWECAKGHTQVVGSLKELKKLVTPRNRYFIARHGEATHNVENKIGAGPEQGYNISRLTEKGESQVVKAAQTIKKEKINLIVTSSYLRAQQTAKIYAKATKARVITDKRFGEIDCGIFNWQPEARYHESFSSQLERFHKAPDNGETLTHVRARMLAAVKDLEKKYQGKNILIVSHGDPLWMLEAGVQALTDEEVIAMDGYPAPGAWKKIAAPVLPFNEEGKLDLHRPYVDEIVLTCPTCKKLMTRVKEVADVWFDAGGVPFAQHHYPFENKAQIDKGLHYPADYISEAMDQTRGWFYVLLAEAVALGRRAPYKNVICLGLINDKFGQKMSKSKGNIIEPNAVINAQGVDPIRWYFYTANDLGEPKNFDEAEVAKVTRKLILILYNSFVFWNSYAKHHDGSRTLADSAHILDRWILASLATLTEGVTRDLERYAIGDAAKKIEQFTDDLSRWYIRRSRDRFQAVARGDASQEADWEAASHTLHAVLLNLSKLIAPFMPFFADALFQSLGNDRVSVHLADWPVVKSSHKDEDLLKNMNAVRSVAAAVLAARAEAKIKVRQPLASLTIKDRALRGKEELLELLADEVNVKKILFSDNLTVPSGVLLDTDITPALKEEGVIRELARAVQGLRQSARYQMSDEVVLMIDAPDALNDLIQRNSIQLKKAVNAADLQLKRSDKFDADLETKIDAWSVWIAVRKA